MVDILVMVLGFALLLGIAGWGIDMALQMTEAAGDYSDAEDDCDALYEASQSR